jgi:predicted ATPase
MVTVSRHRRFDGSIARTVQRRIVVPSPSRPHVDWSYELLPAVERTVLHRSAIFAAGFTLETTSAVANSPGGMPAKVDRSVAVARLT